MDITLKDNLDAWSVHKYLFAELNDCSRFKAEVHVLSDKRIKIKNVRLKESKVYCGAHPFACDIAGGRKANYLEGADWVEVNDRVNDVLDRLNAKAYVRTSICIIRKGNNRRVKYDGHWLDLGGLALHPEWNKDETDPDAYQDWCLKVAPNSWYPEGTPGTYERVPMTLIPGKDKWDWKRVEANVG